MAELTKEQLDEKYEQVWDTSQLQKDFEVLGFCMGYCVVKNRETKQRGSLDFQHMPRFYFNFIPE